jgi:Ca2+-dependent lipid-binding protein
MADLLERKEYLVGLTIIEARGIQGVDGGGTSDAFFKVRCAGRTQQTTKKYETNSAIWNQTLTFSGITMNQYELETFEMNIDLFDHNALLTNELIGIYSIGLSTLYRNTNHELYKKWITLFNKEVPNKK